MTTRDKYMMRMTLAVTAIGIILAFMPRPIVSLLEFVFSWQLEFVARYLWEAAVSGLGVIILIAQAILYYRSMD